MKEIEFTLPRGMSQLDYLWLNFGGTSIASIINSPGNPSNLVSEEALLNYLKELSIPLASSTINGLMSALDKKTLDSIPEIYATKDSLLNSGTVNAFKYKGTKVFFGDLDESAEIGDVWTITYPFKIEGTSYAANTNVVWVDKWLPLSGPVTSEDNFVSWKDEGDTKVIVLPENSKLIGTYGGKLVLLARAIDGFVVIGDREYPLLLRSSSRPSVYVDGIVQSIAYLSDLGIIDLSQYSPDSIITYLPELTLEYLDSYGTPKKVNGLEEESYSLGKDYLVVSYSSDYDLYSVDKYIPNSVLAMLLYMRTEYSNSIYLNYYE